ncbi:MAG TPA: hypothetical protein PKK10_15585 [Woeseiaceae bacterium]|nr:hypothetical protein [Woeseiaceae bacterium]
MNASRDPVASEPYSAELRRLFERPLHAGELDGAYRVYIDEQGVRIALFAELDGAGAAPVIRQLRFQAWGCPHLIAAAEAFCRDFEGQPLAALADFNESGLMQSLDVPVVKTSRILVLVDAVRLLCRTIHESPTFSTGHKPDAP